MVALNQKIKINKFPRKDQKHSQSAFVVYVLNLRIPGLHTLHFLHKKCRYENVYLYIYFLFLVIKEVHILYKYFNKIFIMQNKNM